MFKDKEARQCIVDFRIELSQIKKQLSTANEEIKKQKEKIDKLENPAVFKPGDLVGFSRCSIISYNLEGRVVNRKYLDYAWRYDVYDLKSNQMYYDVSEYTMYMITKKKSE